MHLVMRLGMIQYMHTKAYQQVLRQWGETVTIVDFGYDKNGVLASAMIVTRGCLAQIHIFNSDNYRDDPPLVLNDLLFYYTPDLKDADTE